MGQELVSDHYHRLHHSSPPSPSPPPRPARARPALTKWSYKSLSIYVQTQENIGIHTCRSLHSRRFSIADTLPSDTCSQQHPLFSSSIEGVCARARARTHTHTHTHKHTHTHVSLSLSLSLSQYGLCCENLKYLEQRESKVQTQQKRGRGTFSQKQNILVAQLQALLSGSFLLTGRKLETAVWVC